MFTKSSRLSLTLIESTLYIDPDSDSCNVIRGRIKFNVNKKTIIKSLLVNLNGKMETKTGRFDFFNSVPSTKKTLVSQQLVIHPIEDLSAHHPLVLNPGVAEIDFEMKVPSRLPESVDCCDFSVNYQVSVHMECNPSSVLVKSPLHPEKETSIQNLLVVRLPTTQLIIDDTTHMMSDYRTFTSQWLNYQIILEKKTISLGSDLPITFALAPKFKGVTVDRMTVQLLENRDFHANYDHTYQSAHSILPLKNNKTSIPTAPLEENWEGAIVYRVPSHLSLAHSTKKYDEYSITHTLVVNLLISLPNAKKPKSRKKNILIFRTKVDLLAGIQDGRSLIELPPYDSLEACGGNIKCFGRNCCLQDDGLPSYENLAY